MARFQKGNTAAYNSQYFTVVGMAEKTRCTEVHRSCTEVTPQMSASADLDALLADLAEWDLDSLIAEWNLDDLLADLDPDLDSLLAGLKSQDIGELVDDTGLDAILKDLADWTPPPELDVDFDALLADLDICNIFSAN